MDRHCAWCGKPLASTSKRARFCGSTCRSRAHRSGGSAGAELTAVQPVDLASRRPAEDQEQGIAAATEATLRKAGRLDTWEGQAALHLAQQIELSRRDTISARATAIEKLGKAMDRALKGVEARTSSVQEIRDELARRRRQRAVGAE